MTSMRRLTLIARELRAESSRWSEGEARNELTHAWSQLVYAARAAYADPDRAAELAAIEAAATDVLVRLMTIRAVRMHAKGALQ